MRIGYLSTLYHTSHILRIKKVVNAEWMVFGTGMEIISAFESNKIDLAYIGLTPVLIGIERGLKIVCIAGGHVEGTVIAGKTETEDFPENLTGKTVGVPSKGSIHDIILRRIAMNVDFKIKNYPWAEMILDDFIDGKIDALCGTPNLAILARRYGAKVLISPSEIWRWNPSCGIVIKRDFLNNNQENILDFLIKHEWGTNILRESRGFSAFLLSKHLKNELDTKTIKEILDLSPKYCSSLPKEYMQSTLKLSKFMADLGYLKTPLKLREIFDKTLIKEVHPQKAHYTEI